MGASRWIYFSNRYRHPQSALDELREEVFQRSWRDREPTVGSLADLVESGILEEEGGAHSIIDVDRVIEASDSDYEEDGAVRIIAAWEVVEYFGVEHPTRDQIMRVYKNSASDLPPMFRGSGCCTSVYDDRKNIVGLVFWGMTGD